jgi:hypothetical protein
VVKKIVDPVKKEAQKATSEITKLQSMVKCPISVTSNFPKCATNYLLDLLGYVIFAIAFFIRLIWISWLNFLIWFLNWFLVPSVRAVVNFSMDLLMRPEWKLAGSLAIPYFDIWNLRKNDVIRIVQLVFPFFNRTSDMKKCYCAESLVWTFQPLQIKEQSWVQWMESTFGPVGDAMKWMVSAYTESFSAKETATSSSPIIVSYGLALIFFIIFWGLQFIDKDEQ